MTKLDRYLNFMPPELKASTNPMLLALLTAWASEDDTIITQLNNTKAQLFVKTAGGTYLDRVASNVGVSRPSALGLLDGDFQQLIPNLSFKQRQVVQSFYNTMDVFWGPTFSRANQTGSLAEPFNVSNGDVFQLIVDNGDIQTVNVLTGDIQLQGAATAQEILNILKRFTGVTASSILNTSTNTISINLRTDTPGPRGSITFLAGFDKLGLTLNYKFIVADLAQRTVLYQVNAGEIIIELPAVVPTLRRTLLGSHHFHTDATLASPVPPADGIWQGSFFYSRTSNPFVLTKTSTSLTAPITEGSVMSEITVSDSSAFPTSGSLIFDFGTDSQEYPVKYFSVPNMNTLLIDPGHIFQHNHLSGASVNLLAPGQNTPYAPRINGSDLAIYLTSPADSRAIVQGILSSLAAAGIIVNFLVLLPEYTYIPEVDNPYND
jgi:hypothetical protein